MVKMYNGYIMSNRVTRDHHNLRRRLKCNGNDITSSGALTVDTEGSIILDPVDGVVKIYDSGDTDDYAYLRVIGGTGALLLVTESVDDDGDIILMPDGDFVDISGCDFKIDAAKKLYFDGGTHTYIHEGTADNLGFVIAREPAFFITNNATGLNTVSFKTCCAGFTRAEATFSATALIGSGGTDDTDIDFRVTNKYRLEMTGDITTMNLIFPEVSGNFLLVCTTDGDHDVTNWKVFEKDLSAATTTDVMWAGGSVPAFTSSGIDIVSFYWDASEQQAYGVASLAFATP